MISVIPEKAKQMEQKFAQDNLPMNLPHLNRNQVIGE